MGPGPNQYPPNRPPWLPEPPAENTMLESGSATNRLLHNNSNNPSSGFFREEKRFADYSHPPPIVRHSTATAQFGRQAYPQRSNGERHEGASNYQRPAQHNSFRPTYSRRVSLLDPNLVHAPAYQQTWQNPPSSPLPRFQGPFSGTRGGHRGSGQLVPMRHRQQRAATPMPQPLMGAVSMQPPEMGAQTMPQPLMGAGQMQPLQMGASPEATQHTGASSYDGMQYGAQQQQQNFPPQRGIPPSTYMPPSSGLNSQNFDGTGYQMRNYQPNQRGFHLSPQAFGVPMNQSQLISPYGTSTGTAYVNQGHQMPSNFVPPPPGFSGHNTQNPPPAPPPQMAFDHQTPGDEIVFSFNVPFIPQLAMAWVTRYPEFFEEALSRMRSGPPPPQTQNQPDDKLEKKTIAPLADSVALGPTDGPLFKATQQLPVEVPTNVTLAQVESLSDNRVEIESIGSGTHADMQSVVEESSNQSDSAETIPEITNNNIDVSTVEESSSSEQITLPQISQVQSSCSVDVSSEEAPEEVEPIDPDTSSLKTTEDDNTENEKDVDTADQLSTANLIVVISQKSIARANRKQRQKTRNAQKAEEQVLEANREASTVSSACTFNEKTTKSRKSKKEANSSVKQDIPVVENTTNSEKRLKKSKNEKKNDKKARDLNSDNAIIEPESTDASTPKLNKDHEEVLENEELVNPHVASLDASEEPERQQEDQVAIDQAQAQVPRELIIAYPGDNFEEVHEGDSALLDLSNANSETLTHSTETVAPEKNKKEKKKEKKSTIDNDRMSRKLKAFEKMNRCAEVADRKPKKQQKTAKNNEKRAPKQRLSIPPANRNSEQEDNSLADDHSDEVVGATVENHHSVEQGSAPDAGSSLEKNADANNRANAKATTTEAVENLEESAGSESSDKIAVPSDARFDTSNSEPDSNSIVSPEASSQKSSQEPPDNDNELQLSAGERHDQPATKKLSKKQKKKLRKRQCVATQVLSDMPEKTEAVETVLMEEFEEVTDPKEIKMVMRTMNYSEDTIAMDNKCHEVQEKNGCAGCSTAGAVEKFIEEEKESSQPDKYTTIGSFGVQPVTELNVPSLENGAKIERKEEHGEEKKSEGTSNDRHLEPPGIKKKDNPMNFSIEMLMKKVGSESSKQEEERAPNAEEAKKDEERFFDMMLCIMKYVKFTACNRRWFKALALVNGKGNFFNMEPGSQLEKIALYWKNRPLKKWSDSDNDRFLNCCESRIQKYYGKEEEENKKLWVFFRALIHFVVLARSEENIAFAEHIYEDVLYLEAHKGSEDDTECWDSEYLRLLETITASSYISIRFPFAKEVMACVQASACKMKEEHIHHFLLYLQRQDLFRCSNSEVELLPFEQEIVFKLCEMNTSDKVFDAHPFFTAMLADLKEKKRTIKNYFYKNCYEFLMEVSSATVTADLFTLMEMGRVKESRNNQPNHKICMNLWFGIQEENNF